MGQRKLMKTRVWKRKKGFTVLAFEGEMPELSSRRLCV